MNTGAATAGWGGTDGGFSLIELLAVMAVIVTLLALALPAVNSIAAGTRVTLAVQNVMDEIQYASATAQARNLPVEVCFLKIDDAYRVVQTRILEANGTGTWATRARELPQGVVVFPGADVSNIVGAQDATNFPGPIERSGVALLLYPSGRVRFADPAAVAGAPFFVTLGFERDAAASATTLPPNFATVQIDSRNARITVTRP